MTDCCGYDDEDDAVLTCPDCGHTCCEDCEVDLSLGRCWCKYSLRGDAIFDQSTKDSRAFIRNGFGYRGPFKAIMQVRLEKDLMRENNGSMKARVSECGYSLCNAPASGWSSENLPCPTKLTDNNVSQFVICGKCRSVAYCSEACRTADATTKTRDEWETDETLLTHAERCEPYKDNDKFPYVSVKLREYKKEFGRYPHPLGGAKQGSSKAAAAAKGKQKTAKKKSAITKKKQKV